MFEFLREWFRSEQDDRDPRPLALETPGTWTLEHGQDSVVEITTRPTAQLYDRNGRIPEEMAAVRVREYSDCAIGVFEDTLSGRNR
jgi:hypothetical protein